MAPSKADISKRAEQAQIPNQQTSHNPFTHTHIQYEHNYTNTHEHTAVFSFKHTQTQLNKHTPIHKHRVYADPNTRENLPTTYPYLYTHSHSLFGTLWVFLSLSLSLTHTHTHTHTNKHIVLPSIVLTGCLFILNALKKPPQISLILPTILSLQIPTSTMSLPSPPPPQKIQLLKQFAFTAKCFFKWERICLQNLQGCKGLESQLLRFTSVQNDLVFPPVENAALDPVELLKDK